MTILNTALDITTMMILGSYRFAINNASYQNLKRTTEYKWQELELVGSNPALQYTGRGVQTIELGGVIYPQYRGGLKQLDKIRAEAAKATPLLLISGHGYNFGRWCVVKVGETSSNLLANGSPRKLEFNISLKQYAWNVASKGVIEA